MTASPLLIGGCPRSGTTAIVQLLNSNSCVHISSEENLLNAAKVLSKLLGTRERRAEIYQTKGMRALSDRETLSPNNILLSNFSSEAVWPCIQHLYAWHHAQIHPDAPLVLWGDKQPNYFKEIDAVLAIPGVRYLHITRNPLDVVNSMLRRTEMASQGKDWWKAVTDFDAMIETWAEAYRIVREIENLPGVLHLQYEELVFDFSGSVKKINAFLGTDLEFENILVADPDKHYDRSYLTAEMRARILAHPDVSAYVAKYNNALFVSSALRGMHLVEPVEKSSIVQNIRIFVASTPAEWLPMKVLEFSIRETTKQPVEVMALYTFDRPIPTPSAVENRARTPFSFQRFLIPELCGFSGKAIYLDADMQVFRDIDELWNVDFGGGDLQTVHEGNHGRRGQFSVMLLDCERLGWNVDQIVADLDADKLDYVGLMYEMKVAGQVGRNVSPEWNSLESYDPSKTCLLHYTDMNTQPWISTANPLGDIWVACLRRALASGFITREELVREVQAGHVRPSLLAQIDAGIDATISLSSAIRKLDRGFVAPYRRLHSGKSRPWKSLPSAVKAFLKRSYYRSPIPRIFG